MLGRRHKHGYIGLDLGSSSIKMLQLADGGKGAVVVAAAHIPLSGFSAGSDSMEDCIARALSEGLRKNPFRGRDVVTTLAGGEFQLKNVRLPRMPAEEMESAVAFEARERFDFGDRSSEIRYIPVGEVRHGNDLKAEIVVFGVEESVVRKRIALLESLKLRPRAIDVPPCALARSFARFLAGGAEANAINVFLDVGFGATTIVVTRGSAISFLKMIEIGGRLFNEAVARTLGISDQEAAELRIRIMREHVCGREGDAGAVEGRQPKAGALRPQIPPEMKAAVADAIRPSLERLSRDVQLCLRYFAVTFRGQKPASLTLVGGEASEPMLTEVLTATVDVPCLVGHPLRGFGRLGWIAGRERQTLRPVWAVAAGLALRGMPRAAAGLFRGGPSKERPAELTAAGA